MDSSVDSDCIVACSSEVDQCIVQPKKWVKVELEDNVNFIPSDGHCTANCFAIHFDTPLDKVLELLDKEFQEKISKYSDFSEYDNGKRLLEVFRYITEKRYDSSTADMFINDFSSMFKIVIRYANKMKEGTFISIFLENKINLFKCQGHFNLIKTPEPATTSDRSSD